MHRPAALKVRLSVCAEYSVNDVDHSPAATVNPEVAPFCITFTQDHEFSLAPRVRDLTYSSKTDGASEAAVIHQR